MHSQATLPLVHIITIQRTEPQAWISFRAFLPCYYFVILILKHLSSVVGIEIFGVRCHICYETSSRIFVVLSNHDKAQVGEDIFRYNPWFHTTFVWIILAGLCERACLPASIIAEQIDRLTWSLSIHHPSFQGQRQ